MTFSPWHRWLVVGLLAALLAVASRSASAAWTVSQSIGGSATVGTWFTAPDPPTSAGCDIDFHSDPHALLSWEPSVGPVDGYRVRHKGLFFGHWHRLADVDGETTELALRPSFLRHQYRITAFTVSGLDELESEPAETGLVYCKPPFTYYLDGILNGFDHHSERYITLEWPTDPVSVQYVVLRATQPGGPYAVAGTSTAGTYEDYAVADGLTYYYRVIGLDANGMESEPSNEIAIIDQGEDEAAVEGAAGCEAPSDAPTVSEDGGEAIACDTSDEGEPADEPLAEGDTPADSAPPA